MTLSNLCQQKKSIWMTLGLISLIAFLGACGGSDNKKEDKKSAPAAQSQSNTSDQEQAINEVATGFVKLALSIGLHDKNFVDAYQGPETWKMEAEEQNRSLIELAIEVRALANAIDYIPGPFEENVGLRISMLKKQIAAATTRIEMANGNRYPFNEETRLLYDAIAPDYDTASFDAVVSEIGALLPGTGSIANRVDRFRNSLAIPPTKLQNVFDAAIAECRKRTLAHYELPDGENFRLEFVKDKPWSGYNWYQGGFESLIQVNTDFPIIIDRAIDLGCHEGYPGHHTWNVLLERDVLKAKNWIEYSVYPLFSPLSITAEGSANYGIEMAFPEEEKIQFERDILFPIAGLDPDKAGTLSRLNKLRAKLSHARNHIARAYLDENINREQAIIMSMKYNLMSRERAEQSVDFIDTYRSYVINYNLGKDLIADFIAARTRNGEDRWTAFEHILRTPMSASDIRADINEQPR